MLTPSCSDTLSKDSSASFIAPSRNSLVVEGNKKRKTISDDHQDTPRHAERLLLLEQAISEHLSTGKFFIVAAALRCIEEEKLYFPERTVYSYSKTRFGFSRRTTNTYLCSSYVYESITEDKSLPIPINISHVRSLHKYSPEVRRYIWKKVTESNQTITEENVVAMTIKYETGVSFTELNNELYTPKEIIRAAKGVIGLEVFDLDPASCAFANGLHPSDIAQQIFTETENGLSKEWHGHVWLSPPSGVDDAGLLRMKQWFFQAESKYLSGEITSCHILLRIDMQSDWFLRALYYPHCFFHERLLFSTPTGREKFLTDSHMLVYMGVNTDQFCTQFAHLGSIPGYSSWSFTPTACVQLLDGSTQSSLGSPSEYASKDKPNSHSPSKSAVRFEAIQGDVSSDIAYAGHAAPSAIYCKNSQTPINKDTTQSEIPGLSHFQDYSQPQLHIHQYGDHDLMGHTHIPIFHDSGSMFTSYNRT
ncbi:hypothetical protein BASA61_002818 [Batrachochytrium salamandrivorans]|nr:hypothetical protein BASA60_005901 [Batrachochytrium salamandrivorans]KAH6598743.1 hypothetical protein BASA61_002818 [Batrachochytrium salamandrivorans]KAH9268336.1 hypothetical protein BASA84_000250 [Batrachochytrium salamandrivorans]KAH9277154.1 hypothetical protein BASA83_000013 [Batrachochytrium salamandrivorans]